MFFTLEMLSHNEPWSHHHPMGDLQDPIHGGTLVPYKAIFYWDIPLHRPYIGLVYGRYLQEIGSWHGN